MFVDFYGLQEQPFGVTPDPRYLYLGASHREALASLFCGIKTGRGIVALIAPPGMGKTSLLFRFLEYLRRSARTVFLFQTQCDSRELLRYLVADLGIDARGQDLVAMHEQLNELLLRGSSAGRRFVLVIDEAQNLNDSVLETVRLLSDFETPHEKLLQIVLAGQSQLAERLDRPELAQLRQRIAILGRLEPFSAAEVSRYIEHRLRVAGYDGGRLFTALAVDRIAECSRGVPRNINNLCFNALSLGCAHHCKQIDGDLVSEAAADLDVSSVADRRRREPPPVVLPVPAGARLRAGARRLPTFRAPEKKRTLGRAAVLASVFVLVLLAAVLHRQDSRIAVAQARRTVIATAASLSSHHTAVKAESPTSAAAPGQTVPTGPPVLTDPAVVVATPVPVPTTSAVATQTGAPKPPPNEMQASVSLNRTIDQAAPPQVKFTAGTTMVIVKPHDNLRQICLRYVGSYNAQVVSKISKLNPELTDPDRIAIGQRIVLPRSIGGKSDISRASARPKP